MKFVIGSHYVSARKLLHERSLQTRRYCVRLMMLAAIVVPVGVHAATTWPSVTLPKNVNVFDVTGDETVVNGLPAHIRGFTSPSRPEELAEWFRRSLGKPLVENSLNNKLVLGRLEGEYYLMVQLERTGTGTRGTVAVSHLKAAYEGQSEYRLATERWLNRLPSGSRLISQTSSKDGGKLASHLIFVNGHGEELNRERLKEMLRQDGMTLEREVQTAGGSTGRPADDGLQGTTLYFSGPGKEAMATVFRDGTRQTAIVLNTVSSLERHK